MSKIVNAMQSDSWGHSDRFSTLQLRNLITIDLGAHYIQRQKIYISSDRTCYGLSILFRSFYINEKLPSNIKMLVDNFVQTLALMIIVNLKHPVFSSCWLFPEERG